MRSNEERLFTRRMTPKIRSRRAAHSLTIEEHLKESMSKFCRIQWSFRAFAQHTNDLHQMRIAPLVRSFSDQLGIDRSIEIEVSGHHPVVSSPSSSMCKLFKCTERLKVFYSNRLFARSRKKSAAFERHEDELLATGSKSNWLQHLLLCCLPFNISVRFSTRVTGSRGRDEYWRVPPAHRRESKLHFRDERTVMRAFELNMRKYSNDFSLILWYRRRRWWSK